MDKDNHNEIMYLLGEMRGDIKSILSEAQRTNGRVTKLENQVSTNTNTIANWKGRIAVIYGGITLTGVVVWEFVKSKILQ